MQLAFLIMVVGFFSSALTYLFWPSGYICILAYMVGMMIGLAMSWVTWPWEPKPE